ncbi:DUF4843 domain-containing protein [Marinifilum sp. D714]|uniref:DUF4843 domain-containing protein n=1 Tax=Marinifilum sp. D714 TaxID=2937523 RepID=UPI0027C4203F|nr:DUF4843 domain-containing protein [Marinifilum sp. D714]MDQ2177171.1 DUF4843 domain-containing protein [Marinifilum sp. D714]
MRKEILYTGWLLMIFLLSSCESENEFLSFNNDKAYIYFDMPKNYNSRGDELIERQDSLEYSFALDLNDVDSYIFKVPIAISGLPSDIDRSYKVELIKEESNVVDSDWDKTALINPIFRKGVMFDTLLVKVNRTEELKSQKKSLILQIEANENFEKGREDLLTTKLIFSDILNPPIWWEDWKDIFGNFYLETYLKWQEIYFEGADPNIPPSYIKVSKDSNLPYYWDNMPVGRSAGSQSHTPSVFMFIAQLRDYFENNEVYGTNPDGSKTRIKIY